MDGTSGEQPPESDLITAQPIDDELQTSYLDYAMSVIVGRALPDVKDGLKPVHRRILYAMHDLGIRWNTAHKKSARITGETMGKYHPHGDQSVYDALVRMAQDFSMRQPLVDGQGNFGCFTKDTKVRLTDGRELSFGELVEEHERGKRNFTYTVTDEGTVEIAEIRHPRLTKKDQRLLKVVLDNGEEIRCTPNHRFMLRDGTYTEARHLETGDSLMPLNVRLSSEEDGMKPALTGYEMIYQPGTHEFVLAHVLADGWNLENGVYAKRAGRVRHHVDFDKLNNNPDNILRMRWADHLKLHAEHAAELHKDPEYKEQVIKSRVLGYVNGLVEEQEKPTPESYEECRKPGIPKFENAMQYFDSFTEMIELAKAYNHKVVGVKLLDEREDVYDLTIDGTHNFALAAGVFVHNSIDGDPPAAQRYTEARLTKLAEEMLQDIEKETVPFVDNFDGSLQEPRVLPAKVPNLLVNGSSGIAVGMSTNIPPHNLKEVCEAIIAYIDDPDIDMFDLARIMPGPDFPTGGIIQGKTGIMQYYNGGRGKLTVRAVMEEEQKGNRNRLIITEVPYMVNKASLVKEIADNVKNKRIEGISDILDESDRKGMRVVIELKQGATPEVVENALYSHTRCQTTFGVINVCLVDGQPQTLGVLEIIEEYVKHRQDIVRKRTQYDLGKAKAKAHLLEGLVIALNNIDSIVAFLKKTNDVSAARQGLMDRYELSEKQANAILEMRLSKLTGLEQEKIRDDLKQTKELIEELTAILASERKILSIIKEELEHIIETYASDRRTVIREGEVTGIDLEDLIEPEDVVVTISEEGYCKRLPVETYRAQHRGGKGIIGTRTKDEDFVRHLFIANTHTWLLVFTDKGKVYWTKVYNIPEGSRTSKGKPIINVVDVDQDEYVRAVIPVKEFSDDRYLLFATKKGLLKKTVLSAYKNVRTTGIIAININPDDNLVDVLLTKEDDIIMVASARGMAVKCEASDVRPMGRVSTGVRGIRLGKRDRVVDVLVVKEGSTILSVTENGYGKRSRPDEYRLINRGGKGVRNIITSERNGNVVATKAATEDQDMMLMSRNGITIRTPVKEVRVIGRNTQGVRLMDLKQDDKVVTCTLVERDDDPTV